ncbi:MAG: SIS domain-containing protein [candidate division Zixibacteria bacterium]|nr:SIS domain-containing protein [candidate division Zixibacteria bacterium]
MNKKSIIETAFSGHLETLNSLDDSFRDLLASASDAIIESLEAGGKLMVFGNGGSAADAQHIVTEFVIRLDSTDKRKALPAISLTTNTSLLTAAGNDIGFENIFSRQIEALGQSGDILLAISTSGNSNNVIKAVELSTSLRIKSIGLLGGDGGKLKSKVDFPLVVNIGNTQRIQEMHILAGHIICDLVTSHFRTKA